MISPGSCHCKDEVEMEEALALAKAMELSSVQLDLPKVPGLSVRLQEETITIHVQHDQVVSIIIVIIIIDDLIIIMY